MDGRYGEFLLVAVMLLTATVALTVAMQTASSADAGGPRDVQYTTEVVLFVNETDNRTIVPSDNLTAVQRTEFDRARNGTLTTESRPALIEFAGYPYLIERESRTYEVLIRVYE